MQEKLDRTTRRFLKRHEKRIRLMRRLSRHPVMVPIATVIVLAGLSIGAFLFFNHGSPKFQPITSYIVIVSHDHQQETVPTKEPTVGALLQKLDITLNKGDVVEPSKNTPITQDNFRVNVYRAVPVEVIDGSHKTYALSAAATPRSIAAQAGVKVYSEDDVTAVPVTNFLTQGTIGEQIVIDRATPVDLNLYGTPVVVRTHAKTVGALLKEKHIVMAKGDTVQPAMTTPITTNEQVFILRNGTQIQTVTQSIPVPVQTVTDNSLTFGTTAIRQQGSPGQQVSTYQVTLQNGKSVGQTLLQTVVTVQPVPEIVARGQAVQIPGDKEAVMAQAGISSSDYAYVNYIVSNESGWCPTKVQGEYGSCPGYAPPGGVPAYGGYGLGQATPGSKMAGFGSDWGTNPVTQLRWAASYADSRYGSWAAAYNHWYNYHNW